MFTKMKNMTQGIPRIVQWPSDSFTGINFTDCRWFQNDYQFIRFIIHFEFVYGFLFPTWLEYKWPSFVKRKSVIIKLQNWFSLV